jgi:hypothetical protein
VIWGPRLSRAVAELFGLWLQCWCMGGERKRSESWARCAEEEEGGGAVGWGWVPGGGAGGRGPSCRQWPSAAEAGVGRAAREQEMEGQSGRVGPTWKREEGTWVAPGTCGLAEEKENWPGPKEQEGF